MKLFFCIKNLRKAQITLVEMSLLVMLLGSSLVYLIVSPTIIGTDYSYTIDSFLDSLSESDEFRDLVLREDLSVTSLTNDWTNISDLLNASFENYELTILDDSLSKNIFECTADFDKYISERLVVVSDVDNYDFRKVRLGVCY